MFREAAGFGDGFELSVDVFGIALLPDAYGTHNYDAMLEINAIDNAMVSELVLPITGQRAAQREPVPLRVNCQLFFQDFTKLLPNAAVESLNIRRGV